MRTCVSFSLLSEAIAIALDSMEIVSCSLISCIWVKSDAALRLTSLSAMQTEDNADHHHWKKSSEVLSPDKDPVVDVATCHFSSLFIVLPAFLSLSANIHKRSLQLAHLCQSREA